MNKKKNVLVVGAHPDDEVLGLGGTIAKHASNGDEVSVLILTDGHSSRKDGSDQKIIEKRKEALHQCCEVLGVKNVWLKDFPDQGLDTVPITNIVKCIEEYAGKIRPDIAYIHHRGDLNFDHQVAFQASITAFRPLGSYPVEIYSFETFSSTEWGEPFEKTFIPNHFVNTTDFQTIKEKAIKCYQEELRPYPHPRSTEAIEVFARKWGTVIGVTYAESFVLIRSVH